MHGKVEESLHFCGVGEVEGRGWFWEVLGPSPRGSRIWAGSREGTRREARTGEPSPNPPDCRVGVWSPKGVRR